MSSPRRTLAAAQFTNSVGDGAFLVTSALFFTRVVGLSPAQVGLGLTAGWAAGFLAGVPLGQLADRRGPRGTAVVLALVTAAAVGSFLVVRSFPLFVAAAIGYGVAQCGLAAARQALLAGLVAPNERTEVRAYLQSTLNAGLAIGAAAGGLALHVDSTSAYLAVFGLDALAFGAAALLLGRLPDVPGSPVRPAGEPRLAVLRDRPYAAVTLVNAVMLLYMPMLSLVMPLWVVRQTNAPGWIVAALLVLNTVSVMLFQVRVARRVTDVRTASRSVGWAGIAMLAACLAFALSAGSLSAGSAVAVLVAAAGLQVIGEMMLAAGAWELSFALAPDGRHGQYQGLFGTGTAVARMLGPVLLTTLILTGGRLGWIVLGVVFAAAGLAMTPAVRWARRRQDPAVTVTGTAVPQAA